MDDEEELEMLDQCYRLLASAKSLRAPLSASSNKTTPPLVLGRFLHRSVFEMIKKRITKLDHNLFDVIWPAVKKLSTNKNVLETVEEDYTSGITAPDYYVYSVFPEFMTPLLKDMHNISVNTSLGPHPQSDFRKSSTSAETFFEINIDPDDDFVLSGVIECTRNLSNFELPLTLTIGQLEEVENTITNVLMSKDLSKHKDQAKLESDHRAGSYYTLIEVLEKPSEIRASLASSSLLVALCDNDEVEDSARIHGKHWPYGRGVYLNEDKTVAVWINVHDHIRVLTSTPSESPGEIGLPFKRLSFIMTELHSHLHFVWDPYLGYLSNRPNFLGNGTRFSLVVNLKSLSKERDNLKQLCAMRGLQYKETLSPDIAKLSNYQCLSITESSSFHDFVTAISNLLHLEKDLSLVSNSAQIATLLANIFKRKRSSLVEADLSKK